ncbi:hypothetical protein [Photobacterium minamisatsumaniensis]|uniref:hypothetical protein n=1 Tax=Photobacterium minamisatsumaniensis TaxID=2910233 RepID=UPI003D10ADC0
MNKKMLKYYLISVGFITHLIAISLLLIFLFSPLTVNHVKEFIPSVSSKITVEIFKNENNEAISMGKNFDMRNWPTVGPKASFTLNRNEAVSIVKDTKSLINALKNAIPGQTIYIKDGIYILHGKRFMMGKKNQQKSSPIMITALNPGKVVIELDSLEGFYIDKPNWNISGIIFKGICNIATNCDHAIHVVGDADNTTIMHNTFINFNAALKINKLKEAYPDNGNISNNHFYLTEPHKTSRSVTHINIDHGNDWAISRNIIRDFIKTGGNKVSYGAFIKGGANNGLIENNLVICNSNKNIYNGSQVGLSLGGGGMKKAHRRAFNEFEVKGGILRNNIILHCNDVAVYVNNATKTVIHNNLLFNTKGIDVRFRNSDAILFNNISNSVFRTRDDGKLVEFNNIIMNYKKFTETYIDSNNGNFTFKSTPPKYKNVSETYKVDNNTIINDFCNNSILSNNNHIGPYIEDFNCFY